MGSIGAQKLTMSSICSQKLIESSGRLNDMRDFLFEIPSKSQDEPSLYLAPTHEEAVTSLLSSQLPIGK